MALAHLPHLLWGPPDGEPQRPRVLLGCSGSVATIKVPTLVKKLEQRGVHVVVVPTRSALHFLRAAAEATAREPPVTVATAGAGDTEVDCARADLPSVRAVARATNPNAAEKVVGREGTGVDEGCGTDNSVLCESGMKCNDEGSYLGRQKVLEVNRKLKIEGGVRIQEKYWASNDNTGTEKELSESALPQCCTNVSDWHPSAETDPPLANCNCDGEQGSCTCKVGLSKLYSTNTVQTQTEIAGVNCHPIVDSSDVIMNNNTSKSEIETNITSSPNNKHHARVPLYCLSCLNMLEATTLGSSATQASTTVFPRTSSENKTPTRAWSQSAPEEPTWPDTAAEGDVCCPLSRPLPSCPWCDTQRMLPGLVIAGDALEWEGWRGRGDPVLHIELRRWADMGVIAPLSANTLAKMANGLCDNLLTCVARAWDTNKPLLFCPAMNTHMYEHPLTRRQITALVELGYVEVPAVSKRLMCGDVGGGAMAEVETILDAVWSALHQHLGPISSPPPPITN